MKNTQVLSITQYDAIREFLKKHSPISYQIEGRVVATDLPPIVLSRSPLQEAAMSFINLLSAAESPSQNHDVELSIGVFID
ncbi:hypothetical protein M5X11_21855 [Paenibacillus alginolyticus]|uniref:hypothetical protein n=1 Tax=Paenibacillus alginolyticus TaxID=59839 RepID=UPI00040CC3E8|nr:hypothetical protein [Paenibacillus alginolyticus]MCY9667528.1 hypothetical protein [Paenibacillus alginolyticus]